MEPQNLNERRRIVAWASILSAAKNVIVEGIGLTSLLLAGVALTLIECWGIKKIWKLMTKTDE
jgi:hypothetical protein